MGRLIGLAALVTLFVAGAAIPAGADAVYHSQRLELTSPADADFHGQVVNIHANGPVIGALERYQVVGAAASTSYAVWIQICNGGQFADFIQTAVLTTDARGNGHASAMFSAADLVPFSGQTISIRWVLKSDGAVAYATPCTTVTID
jgi:hypothetical protein